MEKRYIKSATVMDQEIRYYLLLTGENGRLNYGFSVAFGGEETRIPALTTSMQDVLELIERLANHAVTPVSAGDIVYDWLLR